MKSSLHHYAIEETSGSPQAHCLPHLLNGSYKLPGIPKNSKENTLKGITSYSTTGIQLRVHNPLTTTPALYSICN